MTSNGSPCAIRDRCPVCLSVTLVYCGQTTGWIKMPLGTEVGLGPGDTLLDGDSASPYGKGHSSTPTFRPMSFWPTSIVAKRSPISATAELLFYVYIVMRNDTKTSAYACTCFHKLINGNDAVLIFVHDLKQLHNQSLINTCNVWFRRAEFIKRTRSLQAVVSS